MPIPSTTSITRGSLLAALAAIAILALTAGAPATQDAQAAHTADAGDCGDKRVIFVKTRGRWRCQNLYLVRFTVDGRKQPGESRRGAEIDAVDAGEFVTITCQAYAFDEHTGKRLELYDRLPGGYFIPDKYVRTRYAGRIPGAPVCDL